MNGKKILITGALGNLGLWITEYLLAQNYDISILTRASKGLEIEKKVDCIQADIDDRNALEILKEKKFSHVIHLASFNDTFRKNYAQKSLEINTLGTRNLLENLNYQTLENFIYFSTFHIYGNAQGLITEKSIVNPRHDYATTHYFAEIYLRQFANTHCLPYTIFRLSNSYGCPKDKNSTKWYLILNDLAKMAFEQEKIVLKSNGKAIRDFIWMGDVANIVQQTLDFAKAPNDVFNISGERTFTMLEVAQYVQEAYLETFGKNLVIEVNENDRNEYNQNLTVSHQKLQKIIPFNPQNKFKEEAKAIFGLLSS